MNEPSITLNVPLDKDAIEKAISALSAFGAGLSTEPNPAEIFKGAAVQHSTPPPPATETAAPPPPATETAAPPPPADAGRVDKNGVEFDPNFCGESKDPFYASGKTAGQWKKKRNVAEADYNAWYAQQLQDLSGSDSSHIDQAIDNSHPAPPIPNDAPPPPATEQAPPPPAATGGAKPDTFAGLMRWIRDKGLAPDEYMPTLQAFGVNQMPELLQPEKQPLIPGIYTALGGE